MNNQAKILEIIQSRLGTIVLGGFLVAALAFATLLIAEKNFQTKTSFLIVQHQSDSLDYYSLSKSAEYIGKVLGEALHSELFIDEVIKTGKVSPEFLPFDKKDRLEEWDRVVKISRNSQLGIIEVNVFNNNSKEALKVTEAIGEVLTTKNTLFHGGKENIDIRVLSGPILDKNPSVLEVILVSLGGFLLGFMVVISYMIYKNDNENERLTLRHHSGFSGNSMEQPMTPEDYAQSLSFTDRR